MPKRRMDKSPTDGGLRLGAWAALSQLKGGSLRPLAVGWPFLIHIKVDMQRLGQSLLFRVNARAWSSMCAHGGKTET